MLTVHEITTYRVPYPDRIERDAESIGGATRAMRLGRPALHRAPHPDRVYWTSEEYQRDYSARSALALGLLILRAQRREVAAEPLYVRRWHNLGDQRCPACKSITGHASWCDR